MSDQPRALILMGVSGCGKTSVGQGLSQKLGWPFFDGDDFHPQKNVGKMAAGQPLDDLDRAPWLQALRDLIEDHLKRDASLVLACSALKQTYRQQLSQDNPGTTFVYLMGDFDLIYGRMQARAGHYMKVEMLRSQFEALEAPTHAIIVDIDQSIEAISEEIITQLRQDKRPGSPKGRKNSGF
jgi:gluconokinase